MLTFWIDFSFRLLLDWLSPRIIFMASKFGNIGEFVPENEPFHVHLERLQIFMDANSVKKEKQKSVLLSVIGSKVYSVLRTLSAPNVPTSDEVLFESIVDTLQNHYDPKPSEIAERYHFHRRGPCIAVHKVQVNRSQNMLRS